MNLQRLVITFGRDPEIRVLYRRQDGPNPGTVRRRREAYELAKEGLRAALEALEEGPVEKSIGEAGFEIREDKLSAGPMRYAPSGRSERIGAA